MSIFAVGDVTTHPAFQALTAANKPEATEAAGAPDHDGDSDDRGSAAISAAVRVSTGSVTLFA